MIFRFLTFSLLVGCVFVTFLGRAGAAEVTRARAWDHGTHTRFVLEMNEPLTVETFVLSNPNRLVLDMPETVFSLPPQLGDGHPVGPIQGYRFGQFRPGTSRLVIDLSQPALVEAHFLLPPNDKSQNRLVLDLKPVGQERFDRAVDTNVGSSSEIALNEPALGDLAYDASGRFTVVIDPGHGGVDPGAIGRSGIFEKDIALAAARELEKILEANPRYRVVLTRKSDIFIRLRERVAFARREGAHLFISIHADSIGRSSLRGAHVYSLSDKASDKEAAALAAKENKADVIAGVDLARFAPAVSDILVDLAQRETNNVSAEIAELAVAELRAGEVKTLRKAHRQAGFAVLKAPDVPSLLVELGYLSNRADEQLLRTEAGRKPVLNAIARAVDRHFDLRADRRF